MQFVGGHHHHHKNDVTSVDLSSFYLDIEEGSPFPNVSDELRASGSISSRVGGSRPSTTSTNINRPTTAMKKLKSTSSTNNFGSLRDQEKTRSRMNFDIHQF